MNDTNFIDNITKVTASWLNGVNSHIFDECVSVLSLGAKGDGVTDDTSVIQAALNSNSCVFIPPGYTFVVDSLTVPSNCRILLEGKVLRKPNTSSDSYMFNGTGVSNVVLVGNGELDGNSANQSGDRQGLLKFTSPTDCLINIRKAGNNKYSNANAVLDGAGCFVLADATRCHVSVRLLYLYQREGIWLSGASTQSSITNVNAVGDGSNSWTATSISGASASYNRLLNITVDNAGASSVGCDSTYSVVENIISKNNQFNHGVNFGHTGKPATGSRASNITVINAGQGATSGTHCGVNVGGATTDIDLSNITVSGAYSHCINISDSTTRVQVGGKNRLSGALHGCGIYAYGADQVRVSGTTATSNSDYGINLNAGNDCSVTDCDLRGNTTGSFSSTGSRVTVRNTPLSADAMVGTVNIGGQAAGATITVNNNNVAAFSTAIGLFARDATAAAGIAQITNKTSTGFTITVTNAVATGTHNVSYEIL